MWTHFEKGFVAIEILDFWNEAHQKRESGVRVYKAMEECLNYGVEGENDTLKVLFL